MSENFDMKPRADTMTVETDHEQWALHEFAFEQDAGWMPTRLRCYHNDRVMNGELMEGYYDEFIPVAHDVDGGQVIGKKVEYKTQFCPDCEEPARKVDGEPLCPECGLICSQAGPSHEIVRDAKAAGRIKD